MLAASDGTRSLPAFGSTPVDTGRISVSSLSDFGVRTQRNSVVSGRRSSGLHSAFSEAIQDKGGLTGGVRAMHAAKKRQVRAQGLSHDDRRNVLFGQGSPGATASSSMSSLKMGAGLSLGGRPFCAPKEDMGALFLRVEAVRRNAEKNKYELASNRSFIDEVHKITESGRAARAARLLEQGIVEEPVEPPKPADPKPKSMRQRIEACHDNLNSNEKEMQTARTTLDDLLVFAGVKQVEVFDPVNFGKSTGLSAFSLGCGGETSTHVRLDTMTRNLKVNEVRLREHRELLDDVQAARNKKDTKKVQSPLGGSLAGDPFAESGGSRAAMQRPSGSLASRLDAVAEAARSNALELRAFRGTIEDEKEATKRDGPSEVVGKSVPIERVFVPGQLRPDRSAIGPDRTKELSFRVQALHANASRNFDMLSEHGQLLRVGADKTQKDADTASGTGGFGVKVAKA